MKVKKLAKGKDLALTNSGTLSLFFIGTGSAFSRTMDQTNLLVVKGEDHILIDCGTKASQAMAALGCPIMNVKNYFLTHTHSDHVGGMEEIVLLGRYVTKRKPVVVIPEYFEHILWDSVMKGGCAYNERHDGKILTFGDLCEPLRPAWISDKPRETWKAEVGSIRLKIFRTKHIPDNAQSWATSFPSFGVLIDDRALFTSDTRFDPDLIREFASGSEIEAVFHDCQLFTGGVHASLDEIATLPEGIKEKILLTHYADSWEKHQIRAAAVGIRGFAEQHVWYEFP